MFHSRESHEAASDVYASIFSFNLKSSKIFNQEPDEKIIPLVKEL